MAVKEISERAQRIYKEAIVIDMLEALCTGKKDAGYFRTLKDAGITAINNTVAWVTDDLPAAINDIAQFMKLTEGSENVEIVSSVADIERAKKEGKVAVILGMQNSIPFERDLDLIRVFYKLGIRIMMPAYIFQNYLGAGCAEDVDHGLTAQGRKAVKEWNRLGILIDVSHCGDKTALDTAECSEAPIALTHITPLTLVEMRRAKSDDAIKAVAAKGGVIGQVIISHFCEKRDKMGVRATVSDYVDCIDYLVNLVGVDHAGMGFDLTPFQTAEEYYAMGRDIGQFLTYPHKRASFEEHYVEGFQSVSDTIRIAEELLAHGYSEDDTKKILGSNWLRLLKQVWK